VSKEVGEKSKVGSYSPHMLKVLLTVHRDISV
jgi:hypothetical protein